MVDRRNKTYNGKAERPPHKISYLVTYREKGGHAEVFFSYEKDVNDHVMRHCREEWGGSVDESRGFSDIGFRVHTIPAKQARLLPQRIDNVTDASFDRQFCENHGCDLSRMNFLRSGVVVLYPKAPECNAMEHDFVPTGIKTHPKGNTFTVACTECGLLCRIDTWPHHTRYGNSVCTSVEYDRGGYEPYREAYPDTVKTPGGIEVAFYVSTRQAYAPCGFVGAVLEAVDRNETGRRVRREPKSERYAVNVDHPITRCDPHGGFCVKVAAEGHSGIVEVEGYMNETRHEAFERITPLSRPLVDGYIQDVFHNMFDASEQDGYDEPPQEEYEPMEASDPRPFDLEEANHVLYCLIEGEISRHEREYKTEKYFKEWANRSGAVQTNRGAFWPYDILKAINPAALAGMRWTFMLNVEATAVNEAEQNDTRLKMQACDELGMERVGNERWDPLLV